VKKKTENLIQTISASNAALAPEKFFSILRRGLQLRILPVMGEVRDTHQVRFARNLYAIALHIQAQRDHLDLDRKAKREIRESRQKSGRTKAAIENSLESLRKAERIGSEIKDLKPGWLNFQPARKALERLEKRISYLESLTAALIHPNLRTDDEERLVKETPQKLFHPPFKATPGSQELMHRAVEMVDDEIQTFTRGKVRAGQVNKFIAEFLDNFLGWTVAVANVKTIRARYHEQKRAVATPGISPTRP
jgi:hypothetical protein